MATYPMILEQSIYLSTILEEMLTHLSGRIWPPLPIYLGGNGHLSTYFVTAYLLIYPAISSGGDSHPPTYLTEHNRPPIYLQPI